MVVLVISLSALAAAPVGPAVLCLYSPDVSHLDVELVERYLLSVEAAAVWAATYVLVVAMHLLLAGPVVRCHCAADLAVPVELRCLARLMVVAVAVCLCAAAHHRPEYLALSRCHLGMPSVQAEASVSESVVVTETVLVETLAFVPGIWQVVAEDA